MKCKVTIIAAIVFVSASAYAQNVGINSTGANPNNSAMLDVVSSNKGMLVPRVQLTATNAPAPITSPATSLLIYNIAAAGGGSTAVTPGYYYNAGTAGAPNWKRISTDGDHWKIDGNSGTVAGTNFLGTTDAQHLDFRTNNTNKMRIMNSTYPTIGIGTSFPVTNLSGNSAVLHVHDGGASVGSQLILSTHATTNNSRVGLVNFASTQTTNNRVVSSIESYLTAASGTNASGDLRFFTNNNNTLQEKFRIGTTEAVFNEQSIDYDFRVESNGDVNALFVNGGTNRVGIGLNGPSTKLEVSSSGGDAIYGHGTNVGAYVGYETNFTFGAPVQTIQGSGLWAANPSAGYTSIYAQSTGSATVAASINYSTVWIPSYNYGIYGGNLTPSASYSYMSYTSNANSDLKRGVTAFAEYTGTNTTGVTLGSFNIGDGNNGPGIGAYNVGFSNSESAFGSYHEGVGGGAGYYAYVADDLSNRKITGTGSVSEIIPTENHGRITLTCPESPEYWYQDYYTVELVNGKGHLDLDPILADIVVIDEENPIRIFATPQNMLYFNGVTTLNQSKSGVDLVELNGGRNSGTLQVQVVVKPKTNYGEGRFSQAQGPSWAKDLSLPDAKTSNQNRAERPNEIFEWPADWKVYGYEEKAKEFYEKSLKSEANMPKK